MRYKEMYHQVLKESWLTKGWKKYDVRLKMWMKGAANSAHSALQKGLHVAEGIVGGIATAKGLYDAGRTIYRVGRAAAPMIGLL